MSIVTTQPLFGAGVRSIIMGRNGRLTDGSRLSLLANYVNMLAGRRMHVVAQGGNAIGTYTSTAASPFIKTAFHTSPDCGGVIVVMVVGRSTNATHPGAVTWNVADQTASTNETQPTLYLGGSTAGTNGPDDFVILQQQWKIAGSTLSGDHQFTATITPGVTAAISIHSYIICELPKPFLDTSSDAVAVPIDVYGTGAPILDRDIASLTDGLWKIYRRQGAAQIYWSEATGLTTPVQTGATFKNILDSSTAGYSSSAAGFWTTPQRKNRLAGSVVNVVLWCIAEAAGTNNGEIRFTNSAGTIGTITAIDGSGNLKTTTATLDATLTTSDLVIVEHRNASGGANQIFTSGFGMYEYLT